LSGAGFSLRGSDSARVKIRSLKPAPQKMEHQSKWREKFIS
jgi:hypothetical protein